MAEEKILSKENLNKLLQNLPGWQEKNNFLMKEFKLPDFVTAVSFIDDLVLDFENKKHHPDISLNYNRVIFSLTTHSIGNFVTQKDVDLAKIIEKKSQNFLTKNS